MDRSPVFMPVRALAALVQGREASSVELTEQFLDRLESIGPKYNAVVTLTRDRALGQARRAEREIGEGNYRGPLHGIPYGAKDLLATSGGIPTTWGAAPFKEQTFDHNATVVTRLEAAGSVLAAKLAMVELAGGMGYRHPDASFTGPGVNPWNTGAWAGGSSSGSGSAVSAGLVPFAIGSETWGSILGPSAYCGLSGLRPTYGRVSRYGAMALSWTLDKLGPICQTADDCGLVLEAIAGQDTNDPSSSSRSFRYDDGDVTGRRFRIAVFKGVTDGADDDVTANFQQSLDDLAAVASVEEVQLPDYPYEAMTNTIFAAECSAAFDEFMASGKTHELTGSGCKYGAFAYTAVLAKDHMKALRLREVLGREIDGLLAGFDAVAAPTATSVAPPIDEEWAPLEEELSSDHMGAIGNGLGLPSISVPNGLGDRDLPTGIQFMGRAYRENDILAVARAYQSLTGWHETHPGDVQT